MSILKRCAIWELGFGHYRVSNVGAIPNVSKVWATLSSLDTPKNSRISVALSYAFRAVFSYWTETALIFDY
jgi:hypothetical protein